MLLYEDTLAGEPRLVGITDGGLNVLPTLEQKQQIVENAIEVMRCIGMARPKMAIMSATEAVSESVPSSVDAKWLTRMAEAGEFGEVDLRPARARLRAAGIGGQGQRYAHPVAGHADCMVVPNIEAGNLLGKR